MKLHELKSIKIGKKKRVGRGDGSCGTYSGRGMKGQSSRSGGRRRPGFEGGQTPLMMRMPKLRGFKAINKTHYQVVNVADLEEKFKAGDKVTKEMLKAEGLIYDAKKPVKLLGNGELKKAIEITVDLASQSALDKIEKAKGKVTVLKIKKIKSTLTKEEKKKIRTEERNKAIEAKTASKA